MIELLDWQRKAANWIASESANILILAGGYGSGKTAVNTHIVDELICMGLKKGLAIAPTATLIKDTIAESINDEIPEKYIKRIDRSQQMRWQFDFDGARGQLISRGIQYGHEAGRRTKSINADYLWLVEATELPREAYTLGLSRLRTSRGGNAFYPVIIETNPSSKSNWVYTTFIQDSNEIYRDPSGHWWVTYKEFSEHIENRVQTVKCVIFHTTTFANPHFPRAQIAQMKATFSASEYQRLILGHWNALEGRVWEKYNTFVATGEPAAFASRFDRVFVGVDPGQTHPTAIVMIGYADGVYHVFDEYCEVNKSVRDCHSRLQAMAETWGVANRDFVLWVDPAALQWTTEWNQIPGNRWFAYSSKHRGTDPAMNRAMKLGEMLRTGRLVVNAHLCKQVMLDIETTQYSDGRNREQINKSDHDPHGMDAVGYAIQREVY